MIKMAITSFLIILFEKLLKYNLRLLGFSILGSLIPKIINKPTGSASKGMAKG